MSNRDLERVRALLARAAHTETPEEEARSSAVIAARLIAKYGFTIVRVLQPNTRIPVYQPSGMNSDFVTNIAEAWEREKNSREGPIDWDNIEPLRLFRIEKAKGPAFCFCCKKEVRSPSLICKEINGSRVTCTDPKCKESWSGI